jgi:L-iditol 2-dehydrogenase
MEDTSGTTALSVVLAGPDDLRVERIPVPRVGGDAVRVRLGSCGICGSDLRYLRGENPWSQHTLGRHVTSPPNMVLGHEVAGFARRADGETRVAILAYKACGSCHACRAGRENICANVQHIGHATGWGEMDYYPGGMAEEFEVWPGFAYPIPDRISFDEATFLDGLAVSIHACDRARVDAGSRVGIVGLGPIGMMAAQVAMHRNASRVAACDATELPVRLAHGVGLDDAVRADALEFLDVADEYDSIVDTIGTPETVAAALRALRPGGALALLAVHDGEIAVNQLVLSGERLVTTSANNPYADFVRALDLMAAGAVNVRSLVTHRFPLSRAEEAFEIMANKDRMGAYKIVLHA